MIENRMKRLQIVKSKLKENGFKEDGLTAKNIRLMEKALTNDTTLFLYGMIKFDMELNSLEKTLGIIP